MKKYEITGTRSKNFRLDDGTAKAVAEISLNVYEDGALTDNEVYISAVRDDDGNITYIASSESMFDNIVNGSTISMDSLLLPIIMGEGTDSDNKAFSTEYAEAFRYSSYLCYHVGLPIDGGWVRDALDGLMPEVLHATVYKIDKTVQTLFQFGNQAATTEELLTGLGSLLSTSVMAVQSYQKALNEPVVTNDEALQMIIDKTKTEKPTSSLEIKS